MQETPPRTHCDRSFFARYAACCEFFIHRAHVALLAMCLVAGSVALTTAQTSAQTDAPDETNGTPTSQPATSPNVVIIFVDDMGYGDSSVYGSETIDTPNLQRMAREGLKFTDFYVAQPVCSASRAALLTGCYPNRVGISGALGPPATHGINPDETTLAELCKAQGYATAIYGKWHLGDEPAFLPPNHGFDDFLGIPYSNDMWPWHPEYVNLPDNLANRKRGYPQLPLLNGTEIVDPEIRPEDQKRFTTMFTERAVEFINSHRHEPFFLFLAHPMPHVPLFVSDIRSGKSDAGLYGDVIEEIDWSVGRVLDALTEAGIDEQTLLIFASDNGPWLSYGNHAGTTGGLREGKGTTFEGGVRVPCLMRWPEVIPPGVVTEEPTMTIDILPTIAEAIGAPLPDRRIDGKSIMPILRQSPGASSPHEALFFYYHGNNLEAIRSGRWKLHLPHTYRSLEDRPPGKDGQPGQYRWNVPIGLSLFDLKADPFETTNVAKEHPAVVARLLRLVEEMRDDLGDGLTKKPAKHARPPGRVPVDDSDAE